MKELSLETVGAVAALARLRPDPGTLARMQQDLARILHYFSVLEELDLSGVEATCHLQDRDQAMRKDEVRPCLDRQEALKAAPDTDGEHFRVPRVLD
ncbi:MAG: Asp-tRNA(Asn)/Glu-tRNA(Gln) amidotransferase subunit GatC [Acidobacteriota bacterium]